MDKKIVDKLIQFGLITNIGVDANKYTDVDDLIAKGIVTIPGAKSKIMELIGDDSIVVDVVVDKLPVNDDVIDVADTHTVDTVVDTPIEEEVVVEEVVEDVEPATVVVEEVSEIIEPEAEVVVEETEVVKEAPTKSEKKSSRSTKNQ